MITLSYLEVKELCRKETQKLVKERKLSAHCRIHNISYHGVLTFLRGKRRTRNPKLMIDFLTSVGYEGLSSERVILYHFHFNGASETLLKKRRK